MTALEQARVFLAMALCGAACAGVYDAARVLLFAAGGRAAAAAADLLFGPLIACGMTVTALILLVDPLRAYEAAGVALGAALYALTIGTFVRFVYNFMKKMRKKS